MSGHKSHRFSGLWAQGFPTLEQHQNYPMKMGIRVTLGDARELHEFGNPEVALLTASTGAPTQDRESAGLSACFGDGVEREAWPVGLRTGSACPSEKISTPSRFAHNRFNINELRAPTDSMTGHYWWDGEVYRARDTNREVNRCHQLLPDRPPEDQEKCPNDLTKFDVDHGDLIRLVG